jgi:hypothetical protein
MQSANLDCLKEAEGGREYSHDVRGVIFYCTTNVRDNLFFFILFLLSSVTGEVKFGWILNEQQPAYLPYASSGDLSSFSTAINAKLSIGGLFFHRFNETHLPGTSVTCFYALGRSFKRSTVRSVSFDFYYPLFVSITGKREMIASLFLRAT